MHHAVLFMYRSGATAWEEKKLLRPEMPGRTRLLWGWASDDVVAHNGQLYWINLERGMLSCNPFDEYPVLRLDQFPETISEDCQFKSQRPIEADRVVRVSRGRLRYVELTRAMGDRIEDTMVAMWTLMSDPDSVTWWKHRNVIMVRQIWDTDNYKNSQMPTTLPVLALISPANPDRVLFFVDRYLFLADVMEGRLLEYLILGPAALPPPQPPISWRYVVAWDLPPSLTTRVLTGRESLMLRSETARLRSSQFALMIGGDTLKRLEEGLLHRSEEDSSRDKIQIMLFAVLISGLTCLFQFWTWLPKEYLAPIVVAFAAIWVSGCVALPFALFGKHRCEIRLGHHAARAAFMCFSVFVLYGLYRMCVIPTPASGDTVAPVAAVSVMAKWGWIDISFAIFVVLALGGQLLSWVMNECRPKDADT